MRSLVLLCAATVVGCGVSGQDDGFPVSNQSGGSVGGPGGGFTGAPRDAGVDAGLDPVPVSVDGGSVLVDGGVSGGSGPSGSGMPLNPNCVCKVGHSNPTTFFESFTFETQCGVRICGQNTDTAIKYGCDFDGRPTIDLCAPPPCSCHTRDGLSMMCGTFVCSQNDGGVERAWECSSTGQLTAMQSCPVPFP
ncbi:MAG: hypothetical protein U0228_24125 [Myxococcaceae bacterium]